MSARILFYNRMFDCPLGLEQIALPPGYEATEDRAELDRADVVVFHVPTLPLLFRMTKRPGQLWVAWFMECEAHYRRLRDPRFLSRFDLTMSYRRDADVCTGYVPHDLLEPSDRAVPKSSDRLICSFVSGRHDRSGRARLIRSLSRALDLHRYGKRGDRVIPGDTGRETKKATIATYKFTLACENAIRPDYVTEKFFDPLAAGSVPVYLGAPNVDEFAPADNCFVDAARFSGAPELASHLWELDRDDDAYAEMAAWRTRPVRPGFRRLLDDLSVHPFVRLCQRLAAMESAAAEGAP